MVGNRVNGKSDSTESVAFKWGTELLHGIPLPVFINSVRHREGEPVVDATQGNSKCKVSDQEKRSDTHVSAVGSSTLCEKAGFVALNQNE